MEIVLLTTAAQPTTEVLPALGLLAAPGHRAAAFDVSPLRRPHARRRRAASTPASTWPAPARSPGCSTADGHDRAGRSPCSPRAAWSRCRPTGRSTTSARHRRPGRGRRPAAAGRRAPRAAPSDDGEPAASRSATSPSTRPPTPPGCAGRALDLTYKEFELLKFLAQHPGRVFTRSHLVQEVWGYDYFGGTRTVDVHVRRLRAKLGVEYEAMIGTVRNVGYKFVQPAEPGRAPGAASSAVRRHGRRRRRPTLSASRQLTALDRRGRPAALASAGVTRPLPRRPSRPDRGALALAASDRARRTAPRRCRTRRSPQLRADDAVTHVRRAATATRLVGYAQRDGERRSSSSAEPDAVGAAAGRRSSDAARCWSGRTGAAAGCCPAFEQRGLRRGPASCCSCAARSTTLARCPPTRRCPTASRSGRSCPATTSRLAGRQRRRLRRPPRAGRLDAARPRGARWPSLVRPGRLPAGRARRRAARLPLDQGAPRTAPARCTCSASSRRPRACGLGRALLLPGCATWPRAGCPTCCSTSTATTPAAVRLYERAGFTTYRPAMSSGGRLTRRVDARSPAASGVHRCRPLSTPIDRDKRWCRRSLLRSPSATPPRHLGPPTRPGSKRVDIRRKGTHREAHPCRRARRRLLARAVALTACSSSSSTSSATASGASSAGASSAARAPAARTDAAATLLDRHAERRGLDRADRTPWTQWIKDYQTKCSAARRSTTTATGSGAGVTELQRRPGRLRRLRLRARPDQGRGRRGRQGAAASPALDLPMVTGPIAIAYKLNGVTNLTLTPDAARQDLPRQDHHLERPGDRRHQLRRQPAVDQDHRVLPLGLLGHHAELREVPRRRPTRPTSPPSRPRTSSAAGFAGQGKASSQGVAAGHREPPRAPSATSSGPSRSAATSQHRQDRQRRRRGRRSTRRPRPGRGARPRSPAPATT